MSGRKNAVLTIAAAAVLACESEPLNVDSRTVADVIAPRAQHATQLPFRGSFTNATTAAFAPPSTLTVSGTAAGQATHLGRFTATTVDVVDMTNATSTGSLALTAANGDQLFATTAGGEDARDPSDPPNVSSVTLLATVTGGTGRFAGATGTFTMRFTGVIDFAAGTSAGHGSFDGHLDNNQ